MAAPMKPLVIQEDDAGQVTCAQGAPIWIDHAVGASYTAWVWVFRDQRLELVPHIVGPGIWEGFLKRASRKGYVCQITGPKGEVVGETGSLCFESCNTSAGR